VPGSSALKLDRSRATGGAGIAGDAHIPPSTGDVRLQPSAGGEAPASDTGTDAPHSQREAAGLTDSMTEIEQAVVDALGPHYTNVYSYITRSVCQNP
jgi:hypothetical protein